MLKKEGVTIFSGPRLAQHLTFGPPQAKTMKHEYGALECCVEIVKDLDEAVSHIHRFGSSHTDVIVTENRETAEKFQSQVDSGIVSFHFKLIFLLGLNKCFFNFQHASSTTLHRALLTDSDSVWERKSESQQREFTLVAQSELKAC